MADRESLDDFMLDEERDAFLVRRMLVDHRPLLIGGAIPGRDKRRAVIFLYFLNSLFLSNLNPLGFEDTPQRWLGFYRLRLFILLGESYLTEG